MSDRYPTGITPPWFPHSLKVHVIKGYDAYGNINKTGEVPANGSIRRRNLELIENGARVTRRGALLRIAYSADVEVGVGTVIEHGSDTWTVIAVREKEDACGELHFWECDALHKATDRNV